MSKTATIYTLDYCPFCMKAKIFLDEHNVKYNEIRCEDDEEKWRKELKEKFNLADLATFPQVIIDENYIGGYCDLIDKYERKEIVL